MRRSAGLTLALGALLATNAAAQPGHGFGPPPGRAFGPPPERIEALGLSPAQRAKFAALHDEEARKLIRLDADARIAELDLDRLVDGDDAAGAPTQAEVARLIERIGSLRGQMLAARVATRIGVRALLTSAQRAKLRAFRPPRPEHAGGPPLPPPGRE